MSLETPTDVSSSSQKLATEETAITNGVDHEEEDGGEAGGEGRISWQFKDLSRFCANARTQSFN